MMLILWLMRDRFHFSFHIYPVWDLLLPLALTPDSRDQRLLVSLFAVLFQKTIAKWGERNCPSFETAAGDFKHGPLNQQADAVPLKTRLTGGGQGYI